MNTILWWLAQNTVVVAVLVLIVAAMARLLRNRPALVHAMWLLVLIKFVIPPIVTWPWSVNDIASHFTAKRAAVAVSLHQAPSRCVDDVHALAAQRIGSTFAGEILWQSPPDASIPFDNPLENAAGTQPEERDLATVDDATTTTAADPATSALSAPLSAQENAPPHTALIESAALSATDGLPAVARDAERDYGSVVGQVARWLLARTPQWLMLLWLLGGIAMVATQAARLLRQHRLVRQGKSAPKNLTRQLAAIAKALEVKPVETRVVTTTPAPFLWCLGPLRLVWPAGMLDQETLSRSNGVIAHELAHIRRRDHWVAWLELAATAIWWWNPLFWFVRRQMREAAEMACDALALSVCNDRREYAELFLELSSSSKNGTPAPVLGVSTGAPASFERRLTMMLSDRVSGKISLAGTLAIAVIAALVLPGWTIAQQTAATAPVDKSADKSADNPVDEPATTELSGAERPAPKASTLGTVDAPDDLLANRPALAIAPVDQRSSGSANRPAPAADIASTTDPALAPADLVTTRSFLDQRAAKDPARLRSAATNATKTLERELAAAADELKRETSKMNELEDQKVAKPKEVTEVELLRQEMKALRAELKVESLTNKLLRLRSSRANDPTANPLASRRPFPTPPRAPQPVASRPATPARPPAPIARPPIARPTAPAAASPLRISRFPQLTISSDPEQQKLQRELLILDIEEARSTFESSKAEHDRLAMLAKKNLISNSEFGKHQAKIASGEVAIQRATIHLKLFDREVERQKSGSVSAKTPNEAATDYLRALVGRKKPTAAEKAKNASLKERIEVLEEIEKLQLETYRTGQATMDTVLKAKQDLLAAKLEMAKNEKERKALVAELIDAAKQLESIAKAAFNSGEASKADVLKALAFRLKMEAKQ